LANGATEVVVPSTLQSSPFELACLSVYGWELVVDGKVHCPLYHQVRLSGPKSLGASS
jgi:hypothetical protein